MIREVRRRPDALVTLTYEDAHSGEPFEETTTVRELAQEHLENPGPDGAACERQLMEDLQAAVERRRPRKVRNEPVITMHEIVAGLRLDKDGAVYHGPHGCVIQAIYFSRGEVDQAESEPIRNEAHLRHAAAPGSAWRCSSPTAAAARASRATSRGSSADEPRRGARAVGRAPGRERAGRPAARARGGGLSLTRRLRALGGRPPARARAARRPEAAAGPGEAGDPLGAG